MGLKEFDFGELTQEEYLKSNGLSPRDAFIPSEEERKSDQKRLLIMLSQNNNPDTGKSYTAKELSEIFSYDPRTVQKFLREAGYFSQPRPEVRYDELPENEKSFFNRTWAWRFSGWKISLGQRRIYYCRNSITEGEKKTGTPKNAWNVGRST